MTMKSQHPKWTLASLSLSLSFHEIAWNFRKGLSLFHLFPFRPLSFSYLFNFLPSELACLTTKDQEDEMGIPRLTLKRILGARQSSIMCLQSLTFLHAWDLTKIKREDVASCCSQAWSLNNHYDSTLIFECLRIRMSSWCQTEVRLLNVDRWTFKKTKKNIEKSPHLVLFRKLVFLEISENHIWSDFYGSMRVCWLGLVKKLCWPKGIDSVFDIPRPTIMITAYDGRWDMSIKWFDKIDIHN